MSTKSILALIAVVLIVPVVLLVLLAGFWLTASNVHTSEFGEAGTVMAPSYAESSSDSWNADYNIEYSDGTSGPRAVYSDSIDAEIAPSRNSIHEDTQESVDQPSSSTEDVTTVTETVTTKQPEEKPDPPREEKIITKEVFVESTDPFDEEPEIIITAEEPEEPVEGATVDTAETPQESKPEKTEAEKPEPAKTASPSPDPGKEESPKTPPSDPKSMTTRAEAAPGKLPTSQPTDMAPEKMPPRWIGSLPSRGGVNHQEVAMSIPKHSQTECVKDLYVAIQEKTNSYIDEITGIYGASKKVGFDLDYIRLHVVREEFFDDAYRRHAHSTETEIRGYALLQFDQRFRDEVDRRMKPFHQKDRSQTLAFTFVALLGTLVLIVVTGSIFKRPNESK